MATFTRLDAVNQILAGIGESPVSSLNSGLPDAESADRTLAEVAQDILEEGWQCNTDSEITLTPNLDGNILLPVNTLRIDTSGSSATVDAVEREGKLYDRENKTFIFTKPVVVDLVYSVEYESLPYRMRRYIAAVAARVYQERTEGSVSLDSFLRKNEDEARARFLITEESNDDANVLRQSQSVVLATARNNRLSR